MHKILLILLLAISPLGFSQTSDEEEIENGRKRIADMLKDPYSAQFSDMKVLRNSQGTITVCGFVNAKNEYGGYVGKLPFISTKNSISYIYQTTARLDTNNYAIGIICGDEYVQ